MILYRILSVIPLLITLGASAFAKPIPGSLSGSDASTVEGIVTSLKSQVDSTLPQIRMCSLSFSDHPKPFIDAKFSLLL